MVLDIEKCTRDLRSKIPNVIVVQKRIISNFLIIFLPKLNSWFLASTYLLWVLNRKNIRKYRES